MKKRVFRLIRRGLVFYAAIVLFVLGFPVVIAFADGSNIPSLMKRVLSDTDVITKAIYAFPAGFLAVIGFCLVMTGVPSAKKEERAQTPKECKIVFALVVIGTLFMSIGFAWFLRPRIFCNGVIIRIIAIVLFLVTGIWTAVHFADASAKKQKRNWGAILWSWSPFLCVLLIASPWADRPPSAGISLPSIGLFSKENKKATSRVITESIRVSQDLETHIYHVKCTVKNTEKNDANNVMITLYYYVYVGGRQIAHTEPVRSIRAEESYTFTASIRDPYIDPTRDPYLRISVLD